MNQFDTHNAHTHSCDHTQHTRYREKNHTTVTKIIMTQYFKEQTKLSHTEKSCQITFFSESENENKRDPFKCIWSQNYTNAERHHFLYLT